MNVQWMTVGMKKINIALIICLLLTSKVMTQKSYVIKDLYGKYKLSHNLKKPGQKYEFLQEANRPILTLSNDSKFTMTINYCQGIYMAKGSYTVNGNILILKASSINHGKHIEAVDENDPKNQYSFKVNSKDSIEFLENCIGCFTCKGDIFIRSE